MHADRATYRVTEGVAEIRMTRPDAGNAIDPAMVEALDAAIRTAETDDTVRCVLLTADGPAFCVGGDLRFFRSNLDALPEHLDSMISTWHRSALRRLSALPVPVVAAARGGVGGGGLGLLWGADVVVLADDAKLATGFTRLGMTGDGGSSWYLPRLVGLRRAQDLMLRSTPVGAAEALECGLVSRVVPGAELEDTGWALAREFAAGPTWAYGGIKQLLRDSGDRTHADQLMAEYELMRAGAGRADVREGITAFAERRAPEFDGR